MILSAHFLVGTAIATKVQNPALGVLSAFFSHYIFDLLPVWEYDIKYLWNRQWNKSAGNFLKIFLDISFGMLVVLFFSNDILLTSIIGLFAMLPDGLSLLFIIFPNVKLLNNLYKFHKKFNWFKEKNIPLFWKISNEALVYLTAVILLFS